MPFRGTGEGRLTVAGRVLGCAIGSIEPARCLCGLLVASFVLTACPAPGEPTSVAPSERPIIGGVLRVLLAEDVDSLDPHRAARPASWFFARALHRGLLAFPNRPFPEGARPVPDLAAGLPDVSADRRVYTFHLRAGARFGPPASRAVRAADVVASIRRLRGSGVGIAGSLSEISAVSAPEPDTVVIRLREPINDLEWVLAHPQAAIVPAGTPFGVPPDRIAATGPYRVAEYDPERTILLARNDAWSVAIDPVRGAFVDVVEAALGVPRARAEALVAAGRADLVVDPGPPDAAPPPVATGSRDVRVATGCVRYLFLDPGSEPFRSRAARTAVAAAVERALLPGVGVNAAPAPRLLPPTVFGSERTAVVPEDLARARRSLAGVGLGGGFATTLVAGDSARDRAETAAIARSLGRAGIRVRVSLVPPAELYPNVFGVVARTVPMGLATWCADWPGFAGRNMLAAVTARSASAAARAIRAAAAAPRERAAEAWASADRSIVSTATVIPLTWPTEEMVVGTRVRGLGAPMWARGDPAGVWLAR